MEPRFSDDRAMVERLVERHLGLTVTAVQRVPSGVNDVVLVSCDDEQVVVRFNTIDALDEFRKEVWCIERAAEVRVGGPRVLGIGIDGRCAFLLESHVAGRRGDALSGTERHRVWHHIGHHLRRIHAVPVGGFGERLDDLAGDADHGASWRGYLDFNLSALTPADPLLDLVGIDAATQARLRHTFESLRTATFRFGLSHGDPSLSNAILGGDGVLRLIDWGEAHAHVVPQFDLGRILDAGLGEDSSEFRDVLDGYGLDAAAYGAIRPDLIALRLLIATDKVRWAIDRKPERVPAKVETLRTLLTRWETT